MDLKSLDLGDDQDKLIETVAAANANTIVVLETGSPATMPWIDHVSAVVEAWYPGIRGAEALANLLTGEVNPTGKLAITFPKSDADLPHPTLVLPPPASQPSRPAPGADISSFMATMAKGLPPFETYYDEKLKVGYKWYDAEKKPVLFPFGFGLSYTAYTYSGLTVKSGETVEISFTVRNTGKRVRNRDRTGLCFASRCGGRTTQEAHRLGTGGTVSRRIEAGFYSCEPRSSDRIR